MLFIEFSCDNVGSFFMILYGKVESMVLIFFIVVRTIHYDGHIPFVSLCDDDVVPPLYLLYGLDNIMVELFFIFMPRVFVQNMGDLFPYIVLFGFGK